MKELGKNVYQIVKRKDLSSTFLFSNSEVEALEQHLNDLNSRDYDENAKIFKDEENGNINVLVHKNDVYSVSGEYAVDEIFTKAVEKFHEKSNDSFVIEIMTSLDIFKNKKFDFNDLFMIENAMKEAYRIGFMKGEKHAKGNKDDVKEESGRTHYCVVTEWYSNGEVKAYMSSYVSGEALPENTFTRYKDKNVSRDYFEDLELAMNWFYDAQTM